MRFPARLPARAGLLRRFAPRNDGWDRRPVTEALPLTDDTQLSDAQSKRVAAAIREELARRRISRQQLAEQAKLSLSTLEKALGGRRPFTLATTVRLEQALGVSLRSSAPAAPQPPAPPNGDVAPDSLGAYSRRAVAWLEGRYVTLRPSFGEKGAIYAYLTDIAWDAAASCLVFREGERLDTAYSQFGEVSVPNQSGHIYLVTNRHGQFRLITVSRPTITGELYGILTTLLSGRGSALTPISTPIALLPIGGVKAPAFGRIGEGDAAYEVYAKHLQRIMAEPFAVFVAG